MRVLDNSTRMHTPHSCVEVHSLSLLRHRRYTRSAQRLQVWMSRAMIKQHPVLLPSHGPSECVRVCVLICELGVYAGGSPPATHTSARVRTVADTTLVRTAHPVLHAMRDSARGQPDHL
jgi:hypothetical protein